jgi:hypothetical protein
MGSSFRTKTLASSSQSASRRRRSVNVCSGTAPKLALHLRPPRPKKLLFLQPPQHGNKYKRPDDDERRRHNARKDFEPPVVKGLAERRRGRDEGRVGEDKAPPCHAEGHRGFRLDVFPEGAHGDEEEPERQTPEPEADHDGHDADDIAGGLGPEEGVGDELVRVGTELDCMVGFC